MSSLNPPKTTYDHSKPPKTISNHLKPPLECYLYHFVTIFLTNVNIHGKCCLALRVPIKSENRYCLTFAHSMARMTREKEKENCLHRRTTKGLKAFRVIHRLRFRGLLFSTSERGQRDTKQVVRNLMRLRNIASWLMCFRESEQP